MDEADILVALISEFNEMHSEIRSGIYLQTHIPVTLTEALAAEREPVVIGFAKLCHPGPGQKTYEIYLRIGIKIIGAKIGMHVLQTHQTTQKILQMSWSKFEDLAQTVDEEDMPHFFYADLHEPDSSKYILRWFSDWAIKRKDFPLSVG